MPLLPEEPDRLPDVRDEAPLPELARPCTVARVFGEEDIIAQGKHSIDRLMEGISDMEGLLNCNSKVHAGTRRNHSNIGSDRILNGLVAYFQKLFGQRLKK